MWFIIQHSLFCGLHTSSISVAALGFPWYRSSHPDPRKSIQLQIWPHCRSDTASQPSVFSCWGTENNQMVPNQDNMEGDQPVQSHSHAQQPLQPQTCVQAHCPDKTGLPLSVSHYYFSKSWISQCGFIWKETMQLVSRKIEVNAYQVQVSLLWNSSFLVSLWTFQPSLVYSILDVHY